MNNKSEVEFSVNFFEVEDSSADPQDASEAEKYIHATIKTTLSREEYESKIVQNDRKGNKDKSKGKHLVIFNDKSGSMSGGPFKALQTACDSLTDQIFDGKGKKMFEETHVVFYN